MRLEAMKRQAGRPRKGNSAPVGQNFSREELAEQTGDSHSQIQRYIRLTYLIPELLKMVDEENIAFRPAVELSYLTESEQRDLLETIGSIRDKYVLEAGKTREQTAPVKKTRTARTIQFRIAAMIALVLAGILFLQTPMGVAAV